MPRRKQPYERCKCGQCGGRGWIDKPIKQGNPEKDIAAVRGKLMQLHGEPIPRKDIDGDDELLAGNEDQRAFYRRDKTAVEDLWDTRKERKASARVGIRRAG